MYKAKSNCIKDVSPIEPIISREMFEAVQELLKKRGEEFGHTEFRKYPLTMKIQCGNCGRIFKRKEVNGKVLFAAKDIHHRLHQP